jgi:hypothetical protein
MIEDDAVINEIQQYRSARYISPPEVVHRIFGFPMFGVYPAILQLQLHLPGMQSVTYNEEENLEDVVSRLGSNRTTQSISVKTVKIGQQGKYCIENFQNTIVGSKGEKCGK